MSGEAGTQLAQGESAASGNSHAGAESKSTHERHHRSSHHVHHHHVSRSRRHHHHTKSAAKDPKPVAAEPAPAPTKGVIPKISP
jgi:hypothetical protein